jgi:hypothetical protein
MSDIIWTLTWAEILAEPFFDSHFLTSSEQQLDTSDERIFTM